MSASSTIRADGASEALRGVSSLTGRGLRAPALSGEARYQQVAQRNAAICKRLRDGAAKGTVAAEFGISRKRLSEIIAENFGDTITVPAWVPAPLHDEYRAVAEEDGEEAAGGWARAEKRRMGLSRPVVIEPAPVSAAEPEPQEVEEPITPLAAGERQAGYTVKPDDKLYSIDALMRLVARVGGVAVRDIKSHSREAQFLRPRQVFFWLAKRHSALGSPGIARACGGRDHTTVLNGIWRVDHVIGLTGLTVVDDPAAMARTLLSFRWPAKQRSAQ